MRPPNRSEAPAPSRAPEPFDDDDRLGAPDHDIVAVLKITAFRRLWAALALSSFGDWLGLLATAAMAKSLANGSYTMENFAIAGVFILRLAPAVLLGPLAGALADRLNRRWTLVFGDLARFALFASIPLVGTLPWLYTATLLIECFALFWMPAKDATVPNLVPRRRLEAANQISLVATYGSAPVAAAVFAGLALLDGVIRHFVPGWHVHSVETALWFNAATFLVSALVIWRLKMPRGGTAGRSHQVGVLRSIIDGWRFVGNTPVVRGLVTGMLGAFAAAGLVVGLAQTFVQGLGAGPPGFGVMFGAVFVGLAAGMWLGPRVLVDFSRRRLFGLSLGAAGVFLILLAVTPDLVLAALLTVVVGVAGGIAWVTGYTLLGLEVDDEVRGRTFAFLQSAARVVLVGVLALGPAMAAPLGTHKWRITDAVTATYNGAAGVFLLAGLLALSLGVSAYRQMDDRSGTSLRADLRQVWAGYRDARVAAPDRHHPGYLIAFDGGDGAGKSTQARLLTEWLHADQGHETLLTFEPGATDLGIRLRELLLGDREEIGVRAEALLFAADRAHHVDTVIRPAMERGKVVVTDRYIDSSVAYQGAGRELDADEVARLSRWATAGLVPDLTVVLDLPPEISRVRRSADPQRHGEDRMEAQSEEFHERVRQRFLDLAHREPHRYLVLDGSDPREQVQEAIRRRVRDLIPISRRHRADLEVKLVEEEATRRRRAAAESEVRRLDAELRGRSRDEARAREEARQRARAEAEEQLRRETQGRRGAGSGPRSGEEPQTGEETWFGEGPHGEGTPSGEGTRPGGRSGDGPRPGDPGADRRTGQPPGAVDLGAAAGSAADVGAADPGAPETEGRHPGRPGPGRRPWGASSPWGRNPKGPGSSG
ncbi:MAG: dTMP kinase [Kineosporiaceae bacterium]